MRMKFVEVLILLCAMAPAAAGRPRPAVSSPAQEKQQQVSQEEFQAFQALRSQKDPAQKVAQARDFLQKFPQTTIRDMVLLEMMQGYHQLGQRVVRLGQGVGFAVDAQHLLPRGVR